MAGEDIRRRSRRKHAESTSVTKSHKHDKDVDNDTAAHPVADEPERPADLAALRKARLESLEKAPEERRKMKYEYVRPSATRIQSTKDERRERKSTVSVARRKSEEPQKNRRRRPERDESSDAGSEEDYVYGKPRDEGKEKRSISSSKPRRGGSAVHQATSRRAGSNRATVDREAPKRRYTEPLKRRDSREDEDRHSGHEDVRPAPRRSATTVTTASRPPLKRSSTSARPRTEVSAVQSVGSPQQERKGSGIFSSFLLSKVPVERQVSCLTCGSDDIPISKSARLPCSHRMCHSCLKRIFKMSVTDPAHMPPRCCTQDHIDLKHVDKLFDQSFKKNWNRKFLEYNTKHRLYCPARKCGEWIKPNHVTLEHGRKVGKCKRCGTRVCAICNNKAHTSRDCPKDPATKEFVEVAKKSGWQKCYNCSAMVELKEGCNHMTCRCTAEFCMVCGIKWKSCECPWFNYEQVDVHLGNPARYQEELDRRRDQEQRDAALAMRMEALGVDDEGQSNTYGVGNAAGHHMNQNFIQQAREALTANYANAEQAARGLLNGYFIGRENQLPGPPLPVEQTPALLRRPSRRMGRIDAGAAEAARPARQVTVRRRGGLADIFGGRSQTTQEREQERRIHEWANGISS